MLWQLLVNKSTPAFSEMSKRQIRIIAGPQHMRLLSYECAEKHVSSKVTTSARRSLRPRTFDLHHNFQELNLQNKTVEISSQQRHLREETWWQRTTPLCQLFIHNSIKRLSTSVRLSLTTLDWFTGQTGPRISTFDKCFPYKIWMSLSTVVVEKHALCFMHHNIINACHGMSAVATRNGYAKTYTLRL